MLVRSPIYEQLNTALRQLIVSGDVPVGHKFLTEREVSQRFDVSRNTANKALSSLVAEGLLEFRKGVGTFVRGTLDYDLSRLVSFTEKATAAGLKPTTRVLSFRTLTAAKANAAVRISLEVEEDTPLFFIRRLRLADRTPVILEERYVVRELCDTLTRRDVSGSLYQVWTNTFGLSVVGADESIGAVSLTSNEAPLLAVRSGSSALEVIATGIVRNARVVPNERPLWWERTLYRADVYRFRNRIAGLRRSGPAIGELSGIGDSK